MRVSAATPVGAIVLVAALSACDLRPSPFAGLSPGDPPRVGYVDHYVHVAPDGTRTPLPRGRGVSAVAAYLDGFAFSDGVYFEGTSGTALLLPGRREELQPCTSGGAAVSPDGATVAWATFGCPESGFPAPTLIHRRSPRGEDVQRVDIEPDTNALTSVVGLLCQEVVYNLAFGGGAFITDLVEAPRRILGLSSATSIDEVGGRVAGQAGQAGRFGVVADPSADRIQWRLRGARLHSFSPLGRSIVASSGRAARVLDARTGQVRYSLLVPDHVHLSGFAWEDERHVLAVARWRQETAILRFDDQGAAELATPVTRSRGWETGYVLDSQP